jgi:hypothetical protein
MKDIAMLFRFYAACCAAALLCASGAQAQQMPPFPPQAPFEATATLPQGMTGQIRYQGGKMRIDASGSNGPTTAYVDMPARTAVVLVGMQGMNMALEVDLNELGIPDISSLSGERLGAETVAGEACDVWRFIDRKTSRPGLACVTPDGIPMWAGEESARPVMTITSLRRGPQNPAYLDPPPGLATIRASGLGDLPIDIPGLGR